MYTRVQKKKHLADNLFGIWLGLICTFSVFLAGHPVLGQEKRAYLNQEEIQRLIKEMDFKQGDISIGNKIAVLHVGTDYKFFNTKDADIFLSKVWGNPAGFSGLGLILPTHVDPLSSAAWGIVLTYDEDGYISDQDAHKIDYDSLLKEMKKETETNNKQRREEGYQPISLIGWAESPHYDKNTHTVYWAKTLNFGNDDDFTMNYFIRKLGRKGVLNMNIIAGMDQLHEIRIKTPELLSLTEFTAGNKYEEFNSKTDKKALYGIASLVTGGVLAKAGFFKVLLVGVLAFKKFIFIGVIAVFGVFKNAFKKKESTNDEQND